MALSERRILKDKLNPRARLIVDVCTGGASAVAALSFALSLVKPQTPMFLYREWQYMTENPGGRINGWCKCGLLTPLDSSIKDEVLQNAKAAASTPGNRLFPLVPAKRQLEGSE